MPGGPTPPPRVTALESRYPNDASRSEMQSYRGASASSASAGLLLPLPGLVYTQTRPEGALRTRCAASNPGVRGLRGANLTNIIYAP